jgi:RHS repeat-associated protein
MVGNDSAGSGVPLAYDEFGVPLVEAGGDLGNPFGFTGYQMDSVSGLYYAQARYYEPQTGRFTARDIHWHPGNMIYGDNNSPVPGLLSIRQAGNLYAYCVQNPLIYIDFTGGKIDLSILCYPGEIHRAVQKNIIENNPTLSKERWLRYPNPLYQPSADPLLPETLLGRVDLLDPATGYIWEVKPCDWPREIAEFQLANYEKGKFLNTRQIKENPVVFTGVPEQNVYKFGSITDPITFPYENLFAEFKVTYWYDGKGIINYSFEAKKLQPKTSSAPNPAEAAEGAAAIGVLAVLMRVLQSWGTTLEGALTGFFVVPTSVLEDYMNQFTQGSCDIV